METTLSIEPVDAVILAAVAVVCILCIKMIMGFFKDPKKKK